MDEAESKRRGRREYRKMTVALIRDRKDKDAVEVAFSESARFYELLRGNRKFEKILSQLREAKEKGHPVNVLADFLEGAVIEDVQASG